MNTHELWRHYDHQLRQHATAEPGATITRTTTYTRHDAGATGWSGILWSNLDETNIDATITEQLNHFADRAFEWKTYSHDTPTDLPQRLTHAGFTPEPTETLMYAPTTINITSRPPQGITITTLDSIADLDAFVNVHTTAFGRHTTQLNEQLRTHLDTSPTTITCLLAQAGDIPVAASRIEYHPGTSFASLWGGSTLPQWRGRGIYQAMIAHRARLATQHGYSYLTVDALPTSEPILRRIGFKALATTTAYQSPQRLAGTVGFRTVC